MRIVALIAFATIATSALAQSSFQIHGYLTAREIFVKAPQSWTTGGFGRFDVGASSPDDRRSVNLDAAQVGADWTPLRWLALHADGLARREQSGARGDRIGLVQAYADLFTDRWRLRAGSFWLPTSRENVDPLWNSRYTITYSALNTWIGQEARPVGIDLQYSPNFYLTLGATAFRGNDTMGTALAARGWTFGNRLTVYDEHIGLPPPDTFVRAIGPDLDHRNGYSERVRVQLPERALVQLTHIDNRAPLTPLIGEYTPWKTRFDILGGEMGSTAPTTVATEWMRGWTAVGFPNGSFRMDFDTIYLLASHKSGNDRWTARVERFSTNDHAHSPGDPAREHGHALTLAWLRQHGALRFGAEYVRVAGDHPGAADVGFDPRTGCSTVTIELRYGF